MDRQAPQTVISVAAVGAARPSLTPTVVSPPRGHRPGRRNDAAAGKEGPSTSLHDPPSKTVAIKKDSRAVYLGIAALVAVAFLWGTYTPVLRFLYEVEGAPSPSMLTAVRGILGTIVLGLGALLSFESQEKLTLAALDRKCSMSANLDDIAHILREEARQQQLLQQQQQAGASNFQQSVSQLMTATPDSIWVAGAEMGFWNFMGTALQAIGLEYTTATRAAFIIQSTALFTPLVSRLAGERLTTNTWIGCTAAMLGTLLVTAEHTGDPMSQTMISGSVVGDACVLGAAVFYACTTVRLSVYASKFTAVRLATAKTFMLCLISLVWLLAEVIEGTSAGASLSESLASRWENVSDVNCWVWVVFSALGPGALAAYLQTVGQARVSPSQAQIIFSSVPLWSALLAVLVLHEQPMGLLGWTGGMFIIAGGYFAANNPDEG